MAVYTKPSFSLKAYFLMLVAAVSVPLACAIGYSIYQEAQRSIAEEAATIRTLAAVIAGSTSRTLTTNKEALELLAKRPLIRAVDERHCDPILVDFHELFPGFANLAIIDLKGMAVCSAVPQPGGKPVDLSKIEWFQRSLAEKTFLAGHPFIGPITGKWVSVLTYPIHGDRNEVKGFVALPLDLGVFDPKITMTVKPDGLRYGIVSGDGTLIWRNVDPDKLIGKNLSDSEVVQKILATKNGAMEGTPSDGGYRHFAVASIPEINWYVFVSVPSDTIYSQALARSLRGVAVGLMSLLLFVVLALVLARRIEMPIQSLALAARRIKEGNPETRITPDGPREIMEVATEFNSMLDAARTSAQTLEESEYRYRSIFENANTGIVSTDTSGRLISFNETFRAMVGYGADSLRRMNFSDLTHPDDFEREIVFFNEILARRRENYRMEKRYIASDGRIVWIDISAAAVCDKQGEVASFVAVVEDITERKHAEEEMQLAALVYKTSSEAMMVTDANGTIITVNPAFTRMSGYAPDEVIGRSSKILRSGRHVQAFYQAMWEEIMATGKWEGEILDQHKNGDIYPMWVTINSTSGEDGSTLRRVALFHDMTEKKKTEEVIWRQANFDALTGLPNRQMFMDRLDQEIKKSHRAELPLALMFLDLDRFKEINDTLGHDMGDVLLKDTAERLTSCVRDSDTVARLGGDEFTIILGEQGDIGSVERIAQDILRKLAAPFHLGDEVVYLTTSIGITFYPQDAEGVDVLIKNADQAMYAAKSQGRNRYNYFTPAMQEAAQTRMRLASDLRGALAGNQFRVYYQPIVDLSTGQIRKAEALIRWQHPTRGLVNPAEFIPIAEDTGMIIDIGDWVFREAARQVARWRESHHKEFQISVNESPVQFHGDSNCHIAWPEYLRQLGLPGDSIIVEITESSLMEANATVINHLLGFRDAGIQVSLDDFGTGYSSLSYLKKFDIDYLKIDQSFVQNLTHDSEDMALSEAIIVMAHKLGIKVIAEGVETAGQRDLLAAAGCDYAQGHLYSRPLPAEELEEFLARRIRPV